MIDLDNPEAVAAELRRRGLPVYRTGDVIGTDEALREIFASAREGGWDGTASPKPRHINRGRLIGAQRADDPFRCICDPTVLFDPPSPIPVAVEGCPAHQVRRSVQLCIRFLDEELAENATPEEVAAAFDRWRESRRAVDPPGGVSSLDSRRTTP